MSIVNVMIMNLTSSLNIAFLVGRHHGAQLVDDGEDWVAAGVSKLGVHVLDDALPQERYRVVLLLREEQMNDAVKFGAKHCSFMQG